MLVYIIGGMFATCGTATTSPTTGNGIVNPYRNGKVVTISDVLSQTKVQNTQMETVKKMEEIAIAAAKAVHSVLPCREYGIDFGINLDGKPVLFEVNLTPGIDEFALIEDKAIWRRIVENRKMQSE